MTTPSRLPDADLIPLDNVRVRFTVVWLVGASLIVIIVVLQSLLGKYGDRVQAAWGWLLPTIVPTVGMMITVLSYTALDPLRSIMVVRKSFSHIALWLSIFYLLLVLLTILIQPLTGEDPIKLMQTSNLWLGPFQGLVASALGVLFVSKQQKKTK